MSQTNSNLSVVYGISNCTNVKPRFGVQLMSANANYKIKLFYGICAVVFSPVYIWIWWIINIQLLCRLLCISVEQNQVLNWIFVVLISEERIQNTVCHLKVKKECMCACNNKIEKKGEAIVWLDCTQSVLLNFHWKSEWNEYNFDFEFIKRLFVQFEFY